MPRSSRSGRNSPKRASSWWPSAFDFPTASSAACGGSFLSKQQKAPCSHFTAQRFFLSIKTKEQTLFPHAALALFDELFGHAGTAAAASADGEGLGLDQQLFHGHLDVVLFCQLFQNGGKRALLGPLEGDGQAEPGGKADRSSCRVSASWMSSPVRSVRVSLMRWRRLEVAYTAMFRARPPTLPSRMAFRAAKLSSLEEKLRSSMKRMNLRGLVAQLIHQVGDLVELVLLDLHQPQAVGGILVGNGLDRAGFAGAGIAVEQDIVGGGTGQQGAGVGNDLFPLLLVARQLRRASGSGTSRAPAGRSPL